MSIVHYWIPLRIAHDSYRIFSLSRDLFSVFQSQKSFAWSFLHENVLRWLFAFRSSKVVLHAFSPKMKSLAITNHLLLAKETVSQQNFHRLPCISSLLSPAEKDILGISERLELFYGRFRSHITIFWFPFPCTDRPRVHLDFPYFVLTLRELKASLYLVKLTFGALFHSLLEYFLITLSLSSPAIEKS